MSFCVQDYCKSNHLISLQLVVLIGSSNRKNRLTSSDDPISETDSESVFTSLIIGEQRILGHLLAFQIQSAADFHDTRRNDWYRQGSESTTFCSDPANIQIWIWINPEMWIWIPDHCRFRLKAMAEVSVVCARSTVCPWKLQPYAFYNKIAKSQQNLNKILPKIMLNDLAITVQNFVRNFGNW